MKELKMTHCCNHMARTLSEKKVYINYRPHFREYFVNHKGSSSDGYVLWYCPWCGIKLPESLRDEWFDILEKEYGLDDPWSLEQEKLVPKEFTTDEWWKQRGL